MTNSRNLLLIPALLVAAAILPATTQAGSHRPAQITGDCLAAKVAVMASDLMGSTTNSMAAVNVPEAVVKFKQKGANPGCIVVKFAANSIEAPGEQLGVGALLDGAPMFPGGVGLSSDSDENVNGIGSSTHAFAWTAVAAPGIHVVQIQYASQNGTPVEINKHTTLVHHR